MAYQFVHLEAYSRKSDSKGRSVGWVISEAAREPGASPHVPQPLPPQVIHGVDLDEVRRRHDAACEGARTTLANGKSRAVRKDQKSLLTVVASHPVPMDQARANTATAADVAAWEVRTVAWLRQQYGDGLLSVVRHTDESHPHVHAYVLPDDLRAARLHPGTEAKRLVVAGGAAEGEDAKTLNKRGDVAYKRAMREWQDSYHRHVGIPSGLARLGPGRRRLSREEWQVEKTAALAAKTALDRASRIEGRTREHVASVKAKAASVIAKAQERAAATEQQAAAAAALQAAAETKERKAAATLARAGSVAEQIVAKAEQRASRMNSWGGRLRALWDGLRRSSIMAAARLDAAREIARERARADDAARRALDESTRRQEAERRARVATASVQVTARERDQARQELLALRPAASAINAGRRMGR
ncbi:plasmid recombination protein [Azorhizobium sp. AG788]|uniref:plasmid recombination protein n=1 Tax=Azorhizobium sp. AG788 TaxID=2183897 RepID=UPI00105CD5B4|nr:plasmid recombination protein [Azorhizobium sp. AG788]